MKQSTGATKRTISCRRPLLWVVSNERNGSSLQPAKPLQNSASRIIIATAKWCNHRVQRYRDLRRRPIINHTCPAGTQSRMKIINASTETEKKEEAVCSVVAHEPKNKQ